MFSPLTNLSNLKQMVVNVSSSIAQSDTLQNVKETVVSIPSQTKEYFYPTPAQYEMRSVVRLDHAFFVDTDIEEYITPGQQSKPSNLMPSNITNTAIKPSGDARSIISWHDFELCVEDEALFHQTLTEISSYTTTNYSVTTGTTSIVSPHYNVNHDIHFQQSTLNAHNAMNNDQSKHDIEMDKLEQDEELDLNLDEDNPEKLFQNLHKFRKSFIAKRKASGIDDMDQITAFSAPPTSKSDGSYHRRLHTLDLDAMDLEQLDSDIKSQQSIDDEHDDDEKKEAIAPPHSDNPIENIRCRTPQHIARAIEGSREFGIDDIGVINTPISPDPSSSCCDDIEDDRKLSDLDVIDDDNDEEQIQNNNTNDEASSTPKHLRKVSISNKGDLDRDRVQFELDIDDCDEENDSSNMDDSAFMKLQNHFSVERKLSGPRGSMKVTRISVSDELRETLMHQKSISMADRDDKAAMMNIMSLEEVSSNSSFSNQHQSEVGDYVKRVSNTPRGLDPDHAKVYVISDDKGKDVFHYGDSEYMKGMNKHHNRTDSMDTQPDHNDQAPYISKQLTTVIRKEVMSIVSTSDDDDDDDDADNNNRKNEANEGFQSTGYDEEKYDDCSYSDDDGYDEETGQTSMMTLGGNMLNVLRFIPWNEDEYLPQELDESYDERIVPRFGINKELNCIIRLHWNGDALLACDALVIPITEDWRPISCISHMLMNSAGSQYLEHICQEKKNGEYISTGAAQCCFSSFNLPSQYLIHCVPPRYDDRYPVASENAMNSCYWRSLEIASDLDCKSIVLPCIYPPQFFSEQLAIHILARTVRRFLSRYHESVSFESVVICVESEEQMAIYTRIFTIYFPRDGIDLQYSAKYMPAYTGNACGGTVVKLRKQHIEVSPLACRGSSNVQLQHSSRAHCNNYETYDIYGNVRESLRSMVEYKAEPEAIWRAQESAKWQWQKVEESLCIRYKRYWKRCRKVNVDHMSLYQFVYVGGQDGDGRDIIIFVGNRFPAKRLMQEKKLKQALLYVIRELHHIVEREYVIVYLHSFLNEDTNLPPISWITQCFQICKERFCKNLHKFYVIHPNLRLKSCFYVLCTKSFYKNIVYLDSITKLEHHNIDLEHVALPGKSWEYERELFGEDKLAEKMALATDDLVLDALPYR